ncbi:DUF4349 domain-containing protein [Actinopolymorpha sp. B11F2]|uniref:DUF4349 domain-containing protein n=1 Tax=Actinopolymorpha sp. B11F2 TaxID=3160862 RepID=UPI0032E4ACBD
MHRPAPRWLHAPTIVVAALLTATLTLAGCSGDSLNPLAGSSGGRSSADGGAGAAAPEEAALQESGGGDTDASATKPSDGQVGRSSSPARAELEVRSIIRTAELVVRTKEVQAAADRTESLVTATEGYVANQQSSMSPVDLPSDTGRDTEQLRSIHLDVRVPVDDFDRIADEIKGLGTVLADKRDANDVTEEVVDVESRVASQKKSIQRLRSLLGEAKTVGEVIQVEGELATREAELESLQSRFATLSSQAALSTIQITFEAPPAKAAPPEEKDSGFLVGLRGGWNAFVAVLEGLLTAFGAVLPFALTLALVAGLPAWLMWRVRSHRSDSAPSQAETPAPTASTSAS